MKNINIKEILLIIIPLIALLIVVVKIGFVLNFSSTDLIAYITAIALGLGVYYQYKQNKATNKQVENLDVQLKFDKIRLEQQYKPYIKIYNQYIKDNALIFFNIKNIGSHEFELVKVELENDKAIEVEIVEVDLPKAIKSLPIVIARDDFYYVLLGINNSSIDINILYDNCEIINFYILDELKFHHTISYNYKQQSYKTIKLKEQTPPLSNEGS